MFLQLTHNRKRLFFISLISFIFFTGEVFSQEKHRIDSLWEIVSSYKGTDQVTLKKKKQQLSDMFGIVLNGDINTALAITDSLAETCRLLGDSAAYYEALYRNKASIYQPTYDYKKTFSYLNLYAEAIKSLGIQNGYAYVDVGNLYYSFGLSDIAMLYYQKADLIFKEKKQYAGQCTVLDNIALINRGKNNLDSCLWYYNKSAAIRKNILHDPYLEAYNYVQIANAYTLFDQNNQAYDFLNRAREIFERPAFEKYRDFESMNEARIVCFTSLCSYFIRQNQPDSASLYYLKAKDQVEKYQILTQRVSLLNIGARIDLLTGKYQDALEKLKQSQSLAQSRNDDYNLLVIYGLFVEYYQKTGDWKSASLMQERRYRLNDSLDLVNNDDQMLVMNNALLQFDNETQIQRQQNLLQSSRAKISEAENEKRNLLFGLIGLSLLIFATVFFLVRFREKNKLIQKYNRDLEDANATKEKFLSVISHDLRGPFNTLIGMSNLMVSNIRNNKTGQLAANAEAINESSRKAYVLLDNLMQWVSIQKEKITVQKEVFSVVALVDEILLLFRNQAMAQNVTIEKDVQVSMISSDRNLLQVILRNLLSNAIRHIPAEGKVVIRIEEIQNEIRILVEDNGKGIDEQLLNSIFEKKEGMKIAGSGGGLGLKLVHEFTMQLGGTIHAENIPGGGARFTILLTNASAKNIPEHKRNGEHDEKPELSATEKKQLEILIQKMGQYEIFDTTELRKLTEEFHPGENQTLISWKKRMLTAIYHSDAEQYELLIQSVKG